jgi:hypothetical protein
VSDEPTVHWRVQSVYLMNKFEQDRDASRSMQWHRMNRRVNSGSSDGLEQANSKVLAARTSTPDEPTVRWSIASEQFCHRTSTAK